MSTNNSTKYQKMKTVLPQTHAGFKTTVRYHYMLRHTDAFYEGRWR